MRGKGVRRQRGRIRTLQSRGVFTPERRLRSDHGLPQRVQQEVLGNTASVSVSGHF